MKTYDALVIFLGSMKDEDIDKAIKKIGEEIVKLKGAVKKEDKMGRRSFARRLKNQDSGQYVKITFDMEPSGMADLGVRLKMIEAIFRIQITAVDTRKKIVKEPKEKKDV